MTQSSRVTLSAAQPDAVAWRFFAVRVAAVRRLGPSFVRMTFTGQDLDEFADRGMDQRFKLVLPAPEGGLTAMPTGPDWYDRWRRLPETRRPPIRTYTTRAVRPDRREVDVDMVLHGDGGPASLFATRASVGDQVMLLGPNTRFIGNHGGLEFRPPAGHCGPTLLAGDETALPAILTILEQLPPAAYGEAVLEVPTADDVVALSVGEAPTGMRVTWLVRGSSGSGLLEAVRAAVDRLDVRGGVAYQDIGPDPDDDEDLLWDVPGATEQGTGFYAWLAGESSLVTALRRFLVRDIGVDKRQVAFMGYWREGRPGG